METLEENTEWGKALSIAHFRRCCRFLCSSGFQSKFFWGQELMVVELGMLIGKKLPSCSFENRQAGKEKEWRSLISSDSALHAITEGTQGQRSGKKWKLRGVKDAMACMQ